MSDTVIKVENLSKQYRLGQVGRKTIAQDANRWWHKLTGKEDPYLKIGEENNRSVKGESEYVWALRDINFTVKEGEVLGIIGRNGAGKSTLLKILSKVTSPTTGSVKIKGRIASLLEVGTGFHPDLSGRDNIFLNGAILGMKRKEIYNKFDEIVDFAGVERYIDTPVKRYSSGMYVRLAFAVAAHLEPDILIVDEVLAVGDSEFQKKCLGKMKDVSKDGRTVLFVSHNMPAVSNLCDQAMVLQHGTKKFSGLVAESIDYYIQNKRIALGNLLLLADKRPGNGLLRIKEIIFYDKEMKGTDTFITGSEMNITLVYDLKSFPVKSVWFRIQIITQQEEVLFICNNAHSSDTLNLAAHSNKITCTIPMLPLFGGIYFTNVTAYSQESGLLDEIEFAKQFTVVDGDFFGTGKIPGIRKGLFVMHKWKDNQ